MVRVVVVPHEQVQSHWTPPNFERSSSLDATTSLPKCRPVRSSRPTPLGLAIYGENNATLVPCYLVAVYVFVLESCDDLVQAWEQYVGESIWSQQVEECDLSDLVLIFDLG